MNSSYNPKRIINVWGCLNRNNPAEKCRGCIMFCELHDMGATIEYCGLCDNFTDGISKCKNDVDCPDKTSREEIKRYIISKSQNEKENTMVKCPICEYEISDCQCIYGGLGHPNRDKRRKVVFDHLYLFSDKQVSHLISLEKYWATSYVDDEMEEILNSIKVSKEGNR